MKKNIRIIMILAILSPIFGSASNIVIFAEEMQPLNKEKNIIINGDFAGGTTGWQVSPGPLTVDNDIAQSHDGNYAELATVDNNKIYQDFESIPESSVVFTFLHGDYKGNLSANETVQACIGTPVSGSDVDNETCVTSKNGSPSYIKKTIPYTVPDGQTTTRISIQSMPEHGSDNSSYQGHGNLIDNVEVNVTALPTPKPEITGNKTATTPEERELDDEQLIDLFNVSALDEPSGADITKSVVVDDAVNYSKPDDYPVIFTITNSYGKTVELNSTLTVIDKKPEIKTIKQDHTIQLGQTVNDYIDTYGVTATEITEGDLTEKIEIDDSQVNYQTPGTYDVIFTVADEEGNIAAKTVQIIIEEEIEKDKEEEIEKDKEEEIEKDKSELVLAKTGTEMIGGIVPIAFAVGVLRTRK